MGGSMYERRDSRPSRILPGERAGELEAFGFYAVRVSTPGIKSNGVFVPTRHAAGKTVIARLVFASSPGAGADANECLVTLKPELPAPHHAAFLVTALASELTQFAGRRQLIGSADVFRSIATVEGVAQALHVDDHRVAGWALFAKGATGVVVEHRDRVLMWLGTEGAVVPDAIYTGGRDSGVR